MKQIKTGAGGDIYSNPESDELSKHYGLDIVGQLESMLSDELTKSIDKEILKSMGIYSRNVRRMDSINKIFKDVE
jgi:hypothetical protein